MIGKPMSNTNAITILYFASLGDALGVTEEHFSQASLPADVASLRAQLAARDTQWAAALSATNLRCAVNQSLAKPEHPLCWGDEVAFFPPVTGG